jgi:Arc/MetJ-type ribon-helix-helix transcriptional regulator
MPKIWSLSETKEMPQAKVSLSQSHMEFLNRCQSLGFPDKSAVVRQALDEMSARLARERLAESARLYAEIYAQDKELRDLTEAALEDWPQ